MTDAVVKAHGGSTGDTSAQYLSILQAAKWNRFEERIDEYMGNHRRMYFQYCAARGWTDADEKAYEWCYCTKNMVHSLDPVLLVEFDSDREYTWKEARELLTKRVKALAMKGDPYMRGALVAGPNNANSPQTAPVPTSVSHTLPVATANVAPAAKRKDPPSAEEKLSRKARKAKDCKWGARCVRKNCGFRHPPPLDTAVSAVAAAPAPAPAYGGRVVPVVAGNPLAPESRCVLHLGLRGQHANKECRDKHHPLLLLPGLSA